MVLLLWFRLVRLRFEKTLSLCLFKLDLSKALQRWKLRASGALHLCTGITWSTNTAASAMSPQQRHAGQDHAILAARHGLYSTAKQRHPARWSGNTRTWQPIGAVALNPERDSIISEHAMANHIQQLAA